MAHPSGLRKIVNRKIMKREIIYRTQKGIIGLHSDSEYEAREVLLKGTIT